MEPKKEITIFLAEFDFQVDLIKATYQRLKDKTAVLEKEPLAKEMIESTG